MKKKLAKVAVFAAFSCIATQAFFACGDSNSSVNSANHAVDSANSNANSTSSVTSSTNNSPTLNTTWIYYIGSPNVDVKWGVNPDVAPIAASNAVAEGLAVSPEILASCNGSLCGKVSLKASADDEWNALLLLDVLLPDNWAEGNDLSALPGICMKYNVVYSGDAVNDYNNFLNVMAVHLEVADNLVSARDYNAKFRYNVDENLITGNLGDIRVLNLAWSDFVWPTSDTFYANEPYTLEQAVAHLHGIQIRLVQFGEQNVTVAFNIQKIGVYGTCAD